MSKAGLIIQREYLSRVKKKSFVIMTLLGPILIAAISIVPVWLSMRDTDIQLVEVVDETGAFYQGISDLETVKFYYSDRHISDAKAALHKEKFTAILYIPRNAYSANSAMRLFHRKQPSPRTLSHINTSISDIIEKDKLKLKYNISKNEISALRPIIDVLTISLEEDGKEQKSYAVLSMAIGMGGAILIYIFIFLYGVQVMKGVIEEKTNRIVEVIISSVKPFELMLGKIIGIALVGLTQFVLWIVLSLVLISVGQAMLPDHIQHQMQGDQQIEQFIPSGSAQGEPDQKADNVVRETWNNIMAVNWPLMIGAFLFYFLGGYLMYGALFAAIGSAVDNETDTQQFMWPITIPLVLSFVLAQSVTANPDGSLAFWLSVIPFTSPIIMMVRLPFGVPGMDLVISVLVLIASFIVTTWLAGRIYRTGILLYGKKTGYRELWKWLFYKG